jgi:hypothetical protein
MFEETPKWDDLEVRVVIEVDGEPVEGVASGNLTREPRLSIVARASLAAAEGAVGRALGQVAGVSFGEVNAYSYAVVILVVADSADHLVGSAPWRHFEDQAQAVIRAVFDALNRRVDAPSGG